MELSSDSVSLFDWRSSNSLNNELTLEQLQIPSIKQYIFMYFALQFIYSFIIFIIIIIVNKTKLQNLLAQCKLEKHFDKDHQILK